MFFVPWLVITKQGLEAGKGFKFPAKQSAQTLPSYSASSWFLLLYFTLRHTEKETTASNPLLFRQAYATRLIPLVMYLTFFLLLS